MTKITSDAWDGRFPPETDEGWAEVAATLTEARDHANALLASIETLVGLGVGSDELHQAWLKATEARQWLKLDGDDRAFAQ